jgi:hypothetical protein
MATVDKDFRVKHGLVVEGTTATVNGEDIITTGSSTDDLPEGSTNVYYTEGRAKTDAAELLTGATLTNITITGDGDGLTITAENGGIQDLTEFDTDDLDEGTTNLYFTNQRALDATSTAYDPAGSAASAQSAAESYADGLAVNYDPAGSAATAQSNAESYADGLASNYDPAGSAAQALSDANDYVVTVVGDPTVDGTAGNTITDRIATAVSDLVDGAPELLDTLNELAAAINDDASFASTIATSIGEKQNTLTAGSNIDITADTISVTGLDAADISDFNTAALSATASAYEVAGAAQSAVDALDTDDIEEGSTNLYFTDARAVDALEAVVPNFTAVEVNSLAKQVAASGFAANAKANTVLSWAKADFGSAKLLVKAKTSTHSQVSEVLVTLDSADNVAITEFAMVQTDGELATVTVDVSGTDVRVIVTTLGASTDYSVFGTLLV